MVQFYESWFKFYESMLKKCSILWVMLKRMQDSILWVMLNRRVQFFESFWKEGFNSVSYFLKEKWFNSLNHVQKVGSISMSQCWRKSSILWVMLNRRVQFFESCWTEGFNSFSHVEQKGSILWVMLKRRVQFCQSFWKEGFNSVSLIKKKGSIQWIIFFEKFNSWSQNKKGFQCLESFLFFPTKIKFIESHSEKKKFNSLSHIQQKKFNSLEQYLWVLIKKGFNSESLIRKKRVQFWESQ